MDFDSKKGDDDPAPSGIQSQPVEDLSIVPVYKHEPRVQQRAGFTHEDDQSDALQNQNIIKSPSSLDVRKEEDISPESFQPKTRNAECIETGEKTKQTQNYSNPFDDSAVVDSQTIRQDTEERAVTFRSILIGLLTAILGAAISEVFIFKPVRISVDILFLQLICSILGNLLASIPGPLWWNPGSLSLKETVFSVIVAASASNGVHGVEVIATQDVMFEKKMPKLVSIITLISSQLIGYGMAGLLRPFLIYPSKIVFPGVLPMVALFHSLGTQSDTTIKQLTYFKKVLAAISIYEIIPTYLAPAISAVSVWCITLPKVPAITNLFGGALPAEGLGLMAFSADWTQVGSHSPLFVPILAQMTEWSAYFVCILIYSSAYTFNWFGGGRLPFISYDLMDQNTHKYNLTAAVFRNGTGNTKAIEELGLPAFATSFVLCLAFLCMAASASITIGLYSSVMSWRAEKKEGTKITKLCPHREITKKMEDLPLYAYLVILVGAISLAFIASYTADSGLHPLALTTALLLSAIMCLASGYFYGTLGMGLAVSPVSQLLGGLLFPGNAIGNMWFTMYGSATVHQCVSMLKDLKMGQYMHLSPRSVVFAQFIGTISGGLVHVLVMTTLVHSQREVLLMPKGNGIFTGMHLDIMASQATAWGLFTSKLYYPGKIYSIVPYGLIAGFFLPIPFFIFNRFYPKSIFVNFNISLFVACLAYGIFGASSGRFTAMIVGFVSQFYVRKYHFNWYKKYNYILCAALDGGTQITVVLLAFLLQGGAGFQVKMPHYFLNPKGPKDYCVLSTQ